MLEGVIISPRLQIVDERGKIMHMLRADDPEFRRFGEVYFSVVNPGVVKGWHLHKEMTLNYTCPHGEIKLVLYDDREASRTQREAYSLVQVPPGIWNGFQGMAPYPSIVCNCATIPHDPDEIMRIAPDSSKIPYDWSGGTS
jgi:dTDP-4-dehydrorhamnose 3,5-epimerase